MGKVAPILLLVLLSVGACRQGPEPRYEGPAGAGRLIYEPGIGITRRGADLNSDEQGQYAALDKAFSERQWARVINISLEISAKFPEGSRVVDAILKRVKARFELGRNKDPDIGLPQRVMIHEWLFLYLASPRDERLKQLMNTDEATRKYVLRVRDQLVGKFVEGLQEDANSIYDSDQLYLALQDCRTLITYYLPALEIREFRREAAELTRDVMWLMYTAGDFGAVIDINEDLQSMNPAPSVKADALFILGQAQRRNGAHVIAAATFGFLYRGAGLRDTDTRWRPYALMWQIDQTMESSKGYIYDQVPFEKALELLGEYELYMFENPNIPPAIHTEFISLMEEVYDIMIRRDLNSADTYSRLGEDSAEEYYLARAKDWEEQRDKRLAELRQTQ